MSDPVPRRRFRLPRFSLRSLILFVLLAGSGYGLWYRWEPWIAERDLLVDHDSRDYPLVERAWPDAFFTRSGRLLITTTRRKTLIWDWKSGKQITDYSSIQGISAVNAEEAVQQLIMQLANRKRLPRISIQRPYVFDETRIYESLAAVMLPDGMRAVERAREGSLFIYDVSSGEILARLDPPHLDDWEAIKDRLKARQKSNLDAAFLSPDGRHAVVVSTDERAVRIYTRRRPEYWWGAAWLPEFWLTAALGIGLVFSLWRDSRIMRA